MHISALSVPVPEWRIAPDGILVCSKHNDNQENARLLLFFLPIPCLTEHSGGGWDKRRCNDL